MANDNYDEEEMDGEEEEVANDSGFRESTPIVEESSRYVGLGIRSKNFEFFLSPVIAK